MCIPFALIDRILNCITNLATLNKDENSANTKYNQVIYKQKCCVQFFESVTKKTDDLFFLYSIHSGNWNVQVAMCNPLVEGSVQWRNLMNVGLMTS